MFPASGTKSAPVLLFLAPVFFLLMGAWHISRVDSPWPIEAERLSVEHDLQELRSLQKLHGNNHSIGVLAPKEGGEAGVYKYREEKVGDLIPKAYTSLKKLNKEFRFAFCLTFLAWTTFIASLAALGTLALSLRYVYTLKQKAGLSIQALLEAFHRGQARLPLLLYAISITTSVAAVSCFAFLLGESFIGGLPATPYLLLVLLLTVGTFLGGIRIVKAIHAADLAECIEATPRVNGHVVTKEAAPALWQFVEGIACTVQATLPNTLVVGTDATFFATESPLEIGTGKKLPTGRVLYLSLPLLAFLRKEETAAIIAHELAHFSGGDTRQDLEFSPIYGSIIAHVALLRETVCNSLFGSAVVSRPAIQFAQYFCDTFDNAVHLWRREQEMAADAVAAKATSAVVLAQALLRLAALAPHLEKALAKRRVRARGNSGQIVSLVEQSIAQKGFAHLYRQLKEEAKTPASLASAESHPILLQRFAALNVEVDEALLHSATRPERSPLLEELGLAAHAPETPVQPQASAAGTAHAAKQIRSTVLAVRASPAGTEAVEIKEESASEQTFVHALVDDAQQTHATSNKRPSHKKKAPPAQQPRTPIHMTVFADYSLHLKLAFAGTLLGIVWLLLSRVSLEGQMLIAMSQEGQLLVLVAILIGGLCIRSFYKASTTPEATITKQGILFAGMQEMLAWEHITLVTLVSAGGFTARKQGVVELYLEAATPPPLLLGKNADFMPEQNMIRLSCTAPAAMDFTTFFQTLTRCWEEAQEKPAGLAPGAEPAQHAPAPEPTPQEFALPLSAPAQGVHQEIAQKSLPTAACTKAASPQVSCPAPRAEAPAPAMPTSTMAEDVAAEAPEEAASSTTTPALATPKIVPLEPLAVYEHYTGAVLGSLVVMPVLLAWALFGSLSPLKQGGIVVVVCVMALLAWHLYKRSLTPFVTLTDDSIVFTGMPQPIQWEQIRDIEFHASSLASMCIVDFFLEEGVAVPAFKGRNANYVPKLHSIRLTSNNSLNMDTASYFAAITAYWKGEDILVVAKDA